MVIRDRKRREKKEGNEEVENRKEGGNGRRSDEREGSKERGGRVSLLSMGLRMG